jgi:hypothetical protein
MAALLLVQAGCAGKGKRKADAAKDYSPIVSVYGKVLYKSDLDNALLNNGATQDSAKAADAYIRMWINDELVYEKAQENISDPDRIDDMVESYRQSLTIFTYLEQLLKEELSGKISEAKLKDYYEKNPHNFKLESNLIKGLFLKVPRSSHELNNLKQWYKSNTEKAKESIEKASFQNTVIYDYFYDRWISLDDILSNIPVPIGDPNRLAQANKNFEAQDSSFVYLLHIENVAPVGSTMPYEYAKPRVTDILINLHKKEFLAKIEQDLYKKALKNKDIKYYISRPKEE